MHDALLHAGNRWRRFAYPLHHLCIDRRKRFMVRDDTRSEPRTDRRSFRHARTRAGYGPFHPSGGKTSAWRGCEHPRWRVRAEKFCLCSSSRLGVARFLRGSGARIRARLVRIIGGRRIGSFRPVSDPMILKRLDILKRNEIVRCELWQQGIRNYGALMPRGFGRPMYPAALELFFDGRPMELARFPNDGWSIISGVPKPSSESSASERDLRPSRLLQLRGVTAPPLAGHPRHLGPRLLGRDWADSYERVESIDTASAPSDRGASRRVRLKVRNNASGS